MRGDFSFKECDEEFFADAVDGIDGVSFSIFDDVSELGGRSVLGGEDDRIANLLMDGT